MGYHLTLGREYYIMPENDTTMSAVFISEGVYEGRSIFHFLKEVESQGKRYVMTLSLRENHFRVEDGVINSGRIDGKDAWTFYVSEEKEKEDYRSFVKALDSLRNTLN